MKAVICTAYGLPEVLKIDNIQKPIPKNNEVLVKIMATAVNSGDVRVRALVVNGIKKILMLIVLGFSKPRKPILGNVYAGTIEHVGQKVTAFKIGDKVFGMTGFNFGTYAEYITVKEHSSISSMPQNATFEEAASIIFGGQTATYFLNKANISEKINPTILIIGATGAVGLAAIQIAQYYGASITAVCSSAGKSLIENLGITNIILYDKEDFTKQDTVYDIIFDTIGKTTKKQCCNLLKPKGIYKTVDGFEYAKESKQQLAFLKMLFEKEHFKAIIDKTFQFEHIIDAHTYVDTGRKKGSVILKVASISV